MRERWIAVGFLFSLLACNGGGYSGPTYAEAARIVGTYAAEIFWSSTVTIGSRTTTRSCPGSLTVASQAGNSWTGSFVAPGCANASGTLSGSVDSVGTIFVRFSGGVSASPFGSLCLPFGDTSLSLSGSVRQGHLSVSGSYQGACSLDPPIESGTVTVTAVGEKTAG